MYIALQNFILLANRKFTRLQILWKCKMWSLLREVIFYNIGNKAIFIYKYCFSATSFSWTCVLAVDVALSKKVNFI